MRDELRALARLPFAEKEVMETDQYVCEITGTQLIPPVYLDES
jgi:hypothetical protein